MPDPLFQFPPSTAPIKEWSRPLSARCGVTEGDYSEAVKAPPAANADGRCGAQAPRKPKTKIDPEDIRALVEAGQRDSEMAELYGVGRGTISRIRNRLGLPHNG